MDEYAGYRTLSRPQRRRFERMIDSLGPEMDCRDIVLRKRLKRYGRVYDVTDHLRTYIITRGIYPPLV